MSTDQSTKTDKPAISRKALKRKIAKELAESIRKGLPTDRAVRKTKYHTHGTTFLIRK